mmetsp:Transcript_19561/g.48714  ORF Transcript_19561/g.48714 Transcript_19561/m.48714 type:complete len:221 (+) Transcript_19561:1027-1689(+)
MPPRRNQQLLNVLAIHSHVVAKLDAFHVRIVVFFSPLLVVGIVSTIENRLLVHEKEHVGFDDAFNVFHDSCRLVHDRMVLVCFHPKCWPLVIAVSFVINLVERVLNKGILVSFARWSIPVGHVEFHAGCDVGKSVCPSGWCLCILVVLLSPTGIDSRRTNAKKKSNECHSQPAARITPKGKHNHCCNLLCLFLLDGLFELGVVLSEWKNASNDSSFASSC